MKMCLKVWKIFFLCCFSFFLSNNLYNSVALPLQSSLEVDA